MFTKLTTILSIVAATIGIPWAMLVWLAGGMSTVPKFDVDDLKMSLPLPILALLLSAAGLAAAMTSKPKRIPWVWVAAVVSGLSFLTIGVLVITYVDMRFRD